MYILAVLVNKYLRMRVTLHCIYIYKQLCVMYIYVYMILFPFPFDCLSNIYTFLSSPCPTQVLNLSADVLRHVPDPIDYEATAKLVSDDMNPLNVVLLQEVSC